MSEVSTGLRAILARPTVYRAWSRLVGGHRSRSRLVAEYVRARPGMRVLDLGCGPGELVPYLGGTEYIGVDLSGDYIARARELFPGSPEFRVGDATAPPNDLGQFDLVVAFGVVHHIDDRGAARMARAAAAALRPGGRYLTVDPTYQNGQSPIARAIISRDRGQHVREPEGYYALVEPVFDRVEQFVRHDLLRLPYSHCILSCSGPRNP